mmetsp:Transcript_5801/g.11615  ORF Transcript_5801/g.11615 Transcript_5801/m.11615 type:complete len:315 (-) Transcript_5801:83-1027(-)
MANAVGLACIGGAVLSVLLVIYSAWSVLDPWEIGLDYSMVTQTISDSAWGTGRHWIGVGHKFLRFNSTVTTVQFSHEHGGAVFGGPLRSRTADGLEVMLEISFQYLLLPETLYRMYTTYGPSFHEIFVKMAMDLLTVAATKHTARAFFVNRTMIGNMMEESLRLHFKEQALVDVPLFQFQAVSLPTEFEAAIKETQVAEQKIKRVQAKQSMLKVEYETEVIQAQRYVKVRQQQADAVASSIALQNAADVASFNASQICAATAFERVLKIFDGDTAKLLKYMKVRAMRDHPAEHSVLGIRDDVDSPAESHPAQAV